MSTKFILFAFVVTICSWHYAIGCPTIVPAYPFKPNADAEILRNAMKIWGTREGDINEVLCTKPFQQRYQIWLAFDKIYKRSLVDDLESETSRDLQILYRRLLQSPGKILATNLNDYITGKILNDTYGVVPEIVCGTDIYDKSLLRVAYNETFNVDVLEHIKKYKSNDAQYQDVINNFCLKTYCTYPTINAKKALSEAQNLYSINCKTNGDKFKLNLKKYLQTYCSPDLQMIFQSYKTLAKRGISDAIKDAVKVGDEQNAWVSLVSSLESRLGYYADLLYQAVAGAGTNEDRVFRILLQTCERDLGDIAVKYQELQNDFLYDDISGDFRGSINVKGCLKKLLGRWDN